MTGRIRSVTAARRELLRQGWEIASSAPGTVADVWSAAALPWLTIESAGTAAAALGAAGAWNVDGPPRDFDAEDWWYRLRFSASPAADGWQIILGFDGLATLADVWLNGETLFSSENMFV